MTGQGWARIGLAVGVVLSVAGNVTHTVLLDSSVNLALRIIFAACWPGLLFVGIEVLVRTDWRRKFMDIAGRVVVSIPVGIVAAVVSYLHLHSLMTSSGEDPFSSLVGPLAIDGLMVGCTIALLVARRNAAPDPAPVTAPVLHEEPEPLMVFPSMPDGFMTTHAEVARKMVVQPRPPRATPEHLKSAVEALLAGQELDAVVKQSEADGQKIGMSTLRRYARTIRLVRADQNVEIDSAKEKVRPELLDVIRHHIATETNSEPAQ